MIILSDGIGGCRPSRANAELRTCRATFNCYGGRGSNVPRAPRFTRSL